MLCTTMIRWEDFISSLLWYDEYEIEKLKNENKGWNQDEREVLNNQILFFIFYFLPKFFYDEMQLICWDKWCTKVQVPIEIS